MIGHSLMPDPTRSSHSGGLFNLPRPVWLLGWVSLATDSATEAIYPLLPFFLTTVLGAGAVSLGIVEGAAEAVNSLLKIWSGRAADRRPSRRPLVLAGYSISSLSRPLIGLAQAWGQVLTIRVADRVGKGIRSAPRDAMLAGWTTKETRGRVFGFHRAMDHAGAVLGPLLATLFLYFYPGSYRTLFGLTIVPGAIAVALIFFVREDEAGPGGVGVVSGFRRTPAADAVSPFSPTTAAIVALPGELRSFFLVLTLFTLGNSTDAFLLLKLTDVAGSVRYIPLVWAALHVVKSVVSIAGGSWSDRIGRRRVIALGWLVYSTVYVGFALSHSLATLLAWFLLYGFYFGLAEGTEKALVADLAPAAARGFAFGIYNAVIGMGALLASVVFGLLWNAFGSGVAFGTGAALSLIATVLLFAVVRR
jgi:MFS family permease